MIVLLDLNYTLVGNSTNPRTTNEDSIAKETYRSWLIGLNKQNTIILITVRPAKFKEATLLRIKEELNWQPDDAYFNDLWLKAPEFKSKTVIEKIIPKYGSDLTQYLAIESNIETIKAYKSIGINQCLKVM
jgi:hypothetical protein